MKCWFSSDFGKESTIAVLVLFCPVELIRIFWPLREWKFLLAFNEIINKMQTKYSADCFELNNFFLKKLEWVIVPILTKLINKCIDERSFPPCLKDAIIVAVQKSGDVQEPSIFWPISLLPIVAKVFETFLCNKISNFLEIFDLHANQYGFRRQRATLVTL